MPSRSPQGERGLKYVVFAYGLALFMSLPAGGAWIEMLESKNIDIDIMVSLPAGGAWIEIQT